MVDLIMLWFLILCFYVVCVFLCFSCSFFIKFWFVVFICMLVFKKREKEDIWVVYMRRWEKLEGDEKENCDQNILYRNIIVNNISKLIF